MTTFPNVLKNILCFLPSSKTILLIDFFVFIELLINNKNSTKAEKSINKIVFDEGKRHNIFFRTLGNVVMLVPPLAISNKEINLLVDGALKTIKGISKSLK